MARGRIAVAQDVLLGRRMLGEEPEWEPDIVASEEDIQKAYRWYAYFMVENNGDCPLAKKYTIDFMAAQKTGQALLKKMDRLPNHIYRVVGMQCRMSSLGCKLPVHTKVWMKEKLIEIISLTKTLSAEVEKVDSSENQEKTSVQSYIRDQVGEYIAEVDGIIDDASVKKYDFSEFNPYNWLKQRQIKAPHARQLASHFKPLLDEIKQVALGSKCKDDQLKEAYQYSKPAHLKKFAAFLELLINDCGQINANAKLTRKPRAKKVKSVGKQVSKVSYRQHDERFKIKSVQPESIIGANQLWVFNSEKRKLGLYVGLADGLKIKGTTVYNFDEKLSMVKNLRKPEQVLPRVVQGGKVELRKLMDAIKAKPAMIRGRLSGDVVLLRTIR